MTVEPAFAAAFAYSMLAFCPAAKKVMPTPLNALSSSSLGTRSCPLNCTRSPAYPFLSTGTISRTGNARSSSMRRISLPTVVPAPTTATENPEAISCPAYPGPPTPPPALSRRAAPPVSPSDCRHLSRSYSMFASPTCPIVSVESHLLLPRPVKSHPSLYNFPVKSASILTQGRGQGLPAQLVVDFQRPLQ
jgi:hypothetical protein